MKKALTLLIILCAYSVVFAQNGRNDSSSYRSLELELKKAENKTDKLREELEILNQKGIKSNTLEKEHIAVKRRRDSLILAIEKKVKEKNEKAGKDNFGKKLFSQIIIQNEIDPMPDKPDPATFQLTFPKDKDDSWLIDAAIGWKFGPHGKWRTDRDKGKNIWTFTPSFSYHRNTLVDEEQYNWQTGVSITFANVNRTPKKKDLIMGHYLDIGLKYSRNVIDTVQSFLNTGQYDLFRSGKHGLNIGTNTPTGPFLHFFSITPAYEFQYNFKANSKAHEGAILRPHVSVNYEIGSNLERIQHNAKKKISLTLAYTARYDAANSTGFREYYTQLFKSGLNLYLLNDPMTVTLSGSFNYGSDPAKGLKNQQYWLVGLKLQKK